jgi:hypothetical protein
LRVRIIRLNHVKMNGRVDADEFIFRRRSKFFFCVDEIFFRTA